MRHADDLFSQFSRNAASMDEWARKAPRSARTQVLAPAPVLDLPVARRTVAELPDLEEEPVARPWWKLL